MGCRAIPYNGKEPYIFFSYCHKDADFAYPILEQMVKDGYRVWYDDGNEVGKNWPDMIAGFLEESTVCLAIISPRSAASHNCKNEMNFALGCGKSLVPVLMEEFRMPAGMRLQLSSVHFITATDYSNNNAILKKVYENEDIRRCLEGLGKIPLREDTAVKKVDAPIKSNQDAIHSFVIDCKPLEEAYPPVETCGHPDSSEIEHPHIPEITADESQATKPGYQNMIARAEAEAEKARCLAEQILAEAKAKAEKTMQEAAQALAKAQKEKELAEQQAAEEAAQKAAEDAAQRAAEEKAAEEAAHKAVEEEAARQAATQKAMEEKYMAMIAQAKAEAENARLLAEQLLAEASAKAERDRQEAAEALDAARKTREIKAHKAREEVSKKEPRENVKIDDLDPLIPQENDDESTIMAGNYSLGDDNEMTILYGQEQTSAMLLRLNTGEVYRVTSDYTALGRNENRCDWTIRGNSYIGNLHAGLIMYDNHYYLRDEKSSNGTFVKGTRLKENEKACLENMTVFYLHREAFLFIEGEMVNQLSIQGSITALRSEKTDCIKSVSEEVLYLDRSHVWEDGTLSGDRKVHRKGHGEVFVENGTLYLRDPGSINGVYLNGSLIPKNQEIKLNHNDSIKLGDTQFEVLIYNL